MKRALEIIILLSIVSLAFLPGNVCGQVSPCTDMEPPFIASGAKPNILIILDNSSSIDQDFSGNWVGGWAATSKSIIGRNTLQSVVTQLATKANIGLMSFYLLPGTGYLYNWTSQVSGYETNGFPTPLCVNSNGVPNPSLVSCTSSSSCSGSRSYPTCSNETQGYLNLAVSDVNPADSGNQYSAIQTLLTLPTNSSSYLSYSTANDLNANPSISGNCPYIVNAGGTPTAGALQAALQYFNGQYTVPDISGAAANTSPISCWCQKNYVILVTDGLPDSDLNGNYTSASPTPNSIMQQVVAGAEELDGQTSNSTAITTPSGWSVTPSLAPSSFSWTNVSRTINGTQYSFPIPVYVLGLGSEVTNQLDEIAQAGGTGQAYLASNASAMTSALQKIISSILANVASGSSVSTIATSNQSGDNMLQGVFYPAKNLSYKSGTTSLSWPGYLYNWWYAIEEPTYCADVYTNGTTSFTSTTCTKSSDCPSAPTGATAQCLPEMFTSIREDNNGATTYTTPDDILDLQTDYILSSNFNTTTGALTYNLYQDTNGNGGTLIGETPSPAPTLDSLTPLWEAGKTLWETSASSRTIYTDNGSSLVLFNTSNGTLTTSGTSPLGSPANFDSCLQASSTTNTLENLISYISGNDLNLTSSSFCSNGATFETPLTSCTSNSNCTTSPYTQCIQQSSCRNRTLGLCAASATGPFSNTPCSTSTDCTGGTYTQCVPNTWKLGDIVYSTPQVSTNYSYCASASGTFTTTACTQDSNCPSGDTCQPYESLVFVGANDGMLHAFQSGVLSTQGLTSTATNTEIAQLTGLPTSSEGKELWSFIPQNVLPYLRCLATNGCHLYYNDLSPYITTMYVDNDYCQTSAGTFTTTTCTQNSDCSTGQTCASNGGTTAHTVLIGGLRLGGGAGGDYCVNSLGGTNGAACNTASDCPTATTTIETPTTVTNYYCVNSSNITNGAKCNSGTPCTQTGYTTCSSYYKYCTGSTKTACSSSSVCGMGHSCSNTISPATTTINISSTVNDGYCVNSTGQTNWQTCTGSTTSGCTSPYNSACLPFGTCGFTSNIPTDTCSSSSATAAASDTSNGYTTSYNPSTCIGLSSYYALDITNPQAPVLLWEFSDPLMGYSYSGPAIIHKWLNPTTKTGDRYDVMFLSGPTDPSDGSSALPLRVFVLKLDPQTLNIAGVYQTETNTVINNAFGGKLFTTGLDVDGDGYTDYVLFGYSSSNTGKTSWGGGLGLVYTDATTTGTSGTQIDTTNGLLPEKWIYDVNTFAGLIPSAPITAQVATETCFNRTYLFAGSGMYFSSLANASQNFLLGTPFTCNDLFNCSQTTPSGITASSVACTSTTQTPQTNSILANGWLYDLSTASSSTFSLAEAMITNPTADSAAGTIYFTSAIPTTDPCSHGGVSAEWGLNCATGGALSDTSCGSSYTSSSTAGTLYLQTSTGAVYSISGTNGSNPSNSTPSSLSFNNSNNGGRSTGYVTGTPPESALPLTTPPTQPLPTPSGKLIQWIEQ